MAIRGGVDITHSAKNARPGYDVDLFYPPPALDDDSLHRLQRVVRPVHRLQRRETLYRVGAPFQAIYVVISGAIKSFRIAASGEEQIAAFHLPGEFLGLSAIGGGAHPYSAQALEPTLVCALPYERLSELAREIPRLQRQLLRLMSSVIAREERLLEAMAGHSADRRLAFTLIDLAQRCSPQRACPESVRLPMSRAELGSAIGLAPETTTRILRRLERRGWIASSGRRIRLHHPEALRRLAGKVTGEGAA